MHQRGLVLRIAIFSFLLVIMGNFSALASTPLARPAGAALPDSNPTTTERAGAVDPVVAQVQAAGDNLLAPLAKLLATGDAEPPALARAQNAAAALTLTDDSGRLAVQVPTNWRAIASGSWREGDTELGVFLAAATDLPTLAAIGAAPGLFFGVTPTALDATSLAAHLAREQARLAAHCTLVERQPYQDPFHAGLYELYDHCNGTATHAYLILVVAPHSRPQTILLRLNLPDATTLAAAKQVLTSFQVNGDPFAEQALRLFMQSRNQ